MTYRFHEDARDELDSAAAWYEVERIGLAADFVRAVDSAIHRAVADPESWPAIDRRFRRCPVQRFPYDVVFAVDARKL